MGEHRQLASLDLLASTIGRYVLIFGHFVGEGGLTSTSKGIDTFFTLSKVHLLSLSFVSTVNEVKVTAFIVQERLPSFAL